jgi:Flp pilus assembly pilin Flp
MVTFGIPLPISREELDVDSESGQTTVEYAVILVSVIALTIVAFATLQSSILSFFTTIATQLAGIAAGA